MKHDLRSFSKELHELPVLFVELYLLLPELLANLLVFFIHTLLHHYVLSVSLGYFGHKFHVFGPISAHNQLVPFTSLRHLGLQGARKLASLLSHADLDLSWVSQAVLYAGPWSRQLSEPILMISLFLYYRSLSLMYLPFLSTASRDLLCGSKFFLSFSNGSQFRSACSLQSASPWSPRSLS